MKRNNKPENKRGRDSKPRVAGGEAGKKSGWTRPSGKPLRARKGNYFPDEEIEKRKPGARSRTEGAAGNRFSSNRNVEGKPARDFGSTDRPARPYEKKDFSSRDRKPFVKREDRDNDRPARSSDRSGDRERPTERRPTEGRPTEGRPYAKKEFGRDNKFERKSYPKRDADRGERNSDDTTSAEGTSSSEKRSYPKKEFSRDRDSRYERKTFSKRDDERPIRSGEERDNGEVNPGAGDERRDYPKRDFTRDDKGERKPYQGRDDKKREGTYERKPYTRSGESSERKPYAKRDGDAPRSFDRKPYGDKKGRFGKKDFSKPGRNRFGEHRERTKRTTEEVPGEIRLNRFIANAGIASRREADDLITAGVISVNGEIVTQLGTKVLPTDVVKFHDQALKTEKHMYVLLNKPKDFLTTTDDPEERRTVMSLIADACKERIFPVGRLDRNTTGLLLFTNDGELTKRLTHPSSNIKKVYHVELDRNLTLADMKKIGEGIELEDGLTQVDEVAYESPTEKNIIGVELHSGKNRIVRRIFEALDYKVKKLDRVIFAGLTKKDLPRGRWRFLTEMEVNMLKMLTGKKK